MVVYLCKIEKDKTMDGRTLKLRRRSNNTLKAEVAITKATTVYLWKVGAGLITIFGQTRFYLDMSDFANLYPCLNRRAR